jgi:hypothetical protein
MPADLPAEARRRAVRYDGAAVIAQEKTRAETHRALVARHRARFLDGPVLVFDLSANVSYSFNPRGVDALGADGSVYATARVTDAWGILEVTGGVLLSRDSSGLMSKARVPSPATPTGPVLKGDGWTLTLSEGWELSPGPRKGDFALIHKR